MGQLINRLKKFVKSQLREDGAQYEDYHFQDDDDELKKLIDEVSENKSRTFNNNTANFKEKINSEQEACSILGINWPANNDEIKFAYKNLIKKYHPDKVEGLGDEIRKVAEQKSTEINKAYEFLKKKRNF